MKDPTMDELIEYNKNLQKINRGMRNFLLRLNAARIAMNNESVCKTLDDIDSWLRKADEGFCR